MAQGCLTILIAVITQEEEPKKYIYRMYDIILCFITSLLITYLSIPVVISIAKKKKFYDHPDERKTHSEPIPALGGIAIFAGVIFSVVMWTPFEYFSKLQFILMAFIIIFLVGAKDDIDPISPAKKFLAQVAAAAILVLLADVRITSLYGIFGIKELPMLISVLLTMFTILVVINSFNLIDGINGLSASLTLTITLTLGTWFFLSDQMQLALLGFSLAGAAIAFLKYNITPAKIFMGDTGAMLAGAIVAIMAIRFIEAQQHLPPDSPYTIRAAPAVAIGIMILPLFDTLRVFIVRVLKGRSPFHPDRLHIHHMMIDVGFTHMQATSILVLFNLLFIFMVLKFQSIGNLNLLIVIFAFALLFTTMLYMILQNKRKNNQL